MSKQKPNLKWWIKQIDGHWFWFYGYWQNGRTTQKSRPFPSKDEARKDFLYRDIHAEFVE